MKLPNSTPSILLHTHSRVSPLALWLCLVALCVTISPGRAASAEFLTAQYGADLSDSARTSLTPVPSGISESRKQLRLRMNGFVTEAYDNNPLNYSDHDRALFDSSVVPVGRFGISRLDDNITQIGTRLTLESGRRRNSWRARLKFDATLFAHNSFRHYTQWGIEVRRTIRRVYAEAAFSWLPSFNLRNLYWRPMLGRPFGVRYAPANFTTLDYNLELGSEITARLDLRAEFGVALKNYGYPFDERDNRTYSELIRMTWEQGRRLTLSGELGLAQSHAAGRDSVNAIVKDVSYHALLAGCGIRYKCDRRGRIIAAGVLDYQHQKYLSDKPLDTSHYHRLDDDYEFSLSLSYRVTPYLQPEMDYLYRMTRSTVVSSAADFGAYTAHRIGMQVTAYF